MSPEPYRFRCDCYFKAFFPRSATLPPLQQAVRKYADVAENSLFEITAPLLLHVGRRTVELLVGQHSAARRCCIW